MKYAKVRKKFLEKFSLIILNGIVCLSLLGGMWFVARYSFLNETLAQTAFLGLGVTLWIIGIIYILSYNSLDEEVKNVSKKK